MGSPPVCVRSYERNSAPRNVASDGALSGKEEKIFNFLSDFQDRMSAV